MNDADTMNQALEQFRLAAIGKGAEGGDDDHSLYDQLGVSYQSLLAAGDAGRDAFRALATDPDPNVRSWAASQLLYDGDHAMIDILEELAVRSDMIGFNAKMVLNEYRKGTLGSPLPQPLDCKNCG